VRNITAGALLTAYPVAILATKTRAVWLTFAVSTALLAWWTKDTRLRRLCSVLFVVGLLGLAALAMRSGGNDGSFAERLNNTDTVDFRFSAYKAGWTMLAEHPFVGWGASRMGTTLADRMEGFHGEVFVVHNTYLEILLGYGLVGFAIYGLIWWNLCRLHRRIAPARHTSLLASLAGPLWPLLLVVYLLSGCFVIMNYQFVNGLVFTLAGILSAQSRIQKQGGAALGY
jgi:O-antigen ligase